MLDPPDKKSAMARTLERLKSRKRNSEGVVLSGTDSSSETQGMKLQHPAFTISQKIWSKCDYFIFALPIFVFQNRESKQIVFFLKIDYFWKVFSIGWGSLQIFYC